MIPVSNSQVKEIPKLDLIKSKSTREIRVDFDNLVGDHHNSSCLSPELTFKRALSLVQMTKQTEQQLPLVHSSSQKSKKLIIASPQKEGKQLYMKQKHDFKKLLKEIRDTPSISKFAQRKINTVSDPATGFRIGN